jgi:DNA-binding response OmpR family regulator
LLLVYVLLATDAPWVSDEIKSALGGKDTKIAVCDNGKNVRKSVLAETPDVVILDLQIGNMGGMATCMDLRLEESGDRLPHVPILMLLDRTADVHLARRSQADGWLVKPLDPVRLRNAVAAIITGGTFHEGVPVAAVETEMPAEAAAS